MAGKSASCSSRSSDELDYQPSIVKESSQSSSSLCSTENDVPSSTGDWTQSLVYRLGLRYAHKLPFEMVTEHMSDLALLFPKEVDELEEAVAELGSNLSCVGYFDCDSLFDIRVHNLSLDSDEDPNTLKMKVPFKEIDVLKYLAFAKKFGYSLWYTLRERQRGISEAKYQCLFEQFLQMFGIQVMAQPELNSESAEIFGEKVSAQADILCLSRRGGVVNQKNYMAVCEVTKECCSADIDVGPTAPKLRRTDNTSEDLPVAKENTSLPDGLPAQHVGQLLTYLHNSICKEAILGMTVEKTFVTFSRLFVAGETMDTIKRSRGSFKVKEEERPILYHSKRYNYLLEEDRKEIVKAILALTILEHRIPLFTMMKNS
ncbi:uncharacterized protein LOC125661427 [Ostrea edulis]|uniref:uncharacterized protein LOC125661427 n=1 Tax=Ostrea edulis TaxID=37623 RepID=UPI0024AEFC6F|nr:uncharacterized protein LOC125661427 [Ostrea edulis]